MPQQDWQQWALRLSTAAVILNVIKTTVVSTTSNGRVVSRLSAVPFPYTLRILRADDASYDAVILSVKIINKPLSNAG